MGPSGIPFAIWIYERLAVGEALLLQLECMQFTDCSECIVQPTPVAVAVRIVYSMNVGRSFRCGCSLSICLRCTTSMSLRTRTRLANLLCDSFCLVDPLMLNCMLLNKE